MFFPATVSASPNVTAFNPVVDIFFLEFPKAVVLVGRYMLFTYPFVSGIAFGVKIFRYSIDRPGLPQYGALRIDYKDGESILSGLSR